MPKRQFNLVDYVQVKGAAFDNDLLRIELVREWRIAINGATTTSSSGSIGKRS